MSVQLREKKTSGGKISYYLDIYHNKNRWYETLNIHINKKKPTDEDRDKKRLAQEIRSKRENELIVQENGLKDLLIIVMPFQIEKNIPLPGLLPNQT